MITFKLPDWLRCHWSFSVLLLLTLPFLLINLPYVPYTWYDEGLNLAASRALAETGRYGLPSAEGFRGADPALQSGPPLIIVMALLYRVVGPNLLLARLLMTALALMTLITVYTLAYRLYGQVAAFLACVFLLLMPGETTATFIMLGRQVMGEIPALLAIAVGLLLLSQEHPRLKHNLLAGICFGLAIVLKSQILLILTGTVFLWTVYLLLRRSPLWRQWAVTLGTMALIYGLDLSWRSSMAGTQLSDNLSILKQGLLIHIIPFRTLGNFSEQGILLRLIIAAVGIGGTLGLELRRQSPPDQKGRIRVFLMLFVALWMIWFGIVSIGWRRYAFVGLFFNMLLLGGLAAYLLRRLRFRWPHYTGLIGLWFVVMLYFYAPQLADNDTGNKFHDFMDYLKTAVPANAVIMSWEWSADYMTGHQYVHPTTAIANAVTEQAVFRKPYDPALFNPLAACPQYVLLGSFEPDRQVMQAALAVADPEPLFSAGPYQLYLIPSENLQRLPDNTCIGRSIR